MDDREIRQWCMFLHLAQLAGYIIPLGGIIVPVVMWQMKKDESSTIDAHGRVVMNAMISYTIYWIGAIVLCFLLIGFFLLPILAVATIVLPIIGGIKANDGVLWRYPLSLPLF